MVDALTDETQTAEVETNETRLPPGWRMVRLGEINCADTKTINPANYPEEVFEYYSIPAFQETGKPAFEEGKQILSNKVSIANRTILFGKLNPRVLKVWLVDSITSNRKIASTEFIPILCRDDVHPEFIYYVCQADAVVAEARRRVDGSTPSRQRVDPKAFYAITIPLPPLSEQRAIARVLRTVQEAREARRREIALERERKAALMQHLFTHGTRGEPRKMTEIGEMPESWRVAHLSDACQFLQYGTSVRCDNDATGVPVLRIPNVIDGDIDTSELKYATLPVDVVDRLVLDIGDLLFVRTNGRREYAGRCAVYGGELETALFASYLIRARLKVAVLLPDFVQRYTMTTAGRRYLSGRASNAADGKFNINTQTIRTVLTPVPSLSEQHAITDVLDTCDAKIDALEREAMVLDEAFRALLEELMTGRVLVRGVACD